MNHVCCGNKLIETTTFLYRKVGNETNQLFTNVPILVCPVKAFEDCTPSIYPDVVGKMDDAIAFIKDNDIAINVISYDEIDSLMSK